MFQARRKVEPKVRKAFEAPRTEPVPGTQRKPFNYFVFFLFLNTIVLIVVIMMFVITFVIMDVSKSYLPFAFRTEEISFRSTQPSFSYFKERQTSRSRVPGKGGEIQKGKVPWHGVLLPLNSSCKLVWIQL